MNRLHVGLSFAALLATAVDGVALAAHGSRAAGAYLVALGCFHVVEFLAVWMWRREQLSLHWPVEYALPRKSLGSRHPDKGR